MRHTRLAPLWRALPGIGIAAVAVFAAFAVATGGARPVRCTQARPSTRWPAWTWARCRARATGRTCPAAPSTATAPPAPTTSARTRSTGTTRRPGTNEITGEPFDDVADTFVADGPGPDRLDLREVPLPRVHRRDVHDAEAAPAPSDATWASLGRSSAPRSATRSRSSSEQHLPVPGERPPARRLLRQEQRRRPVQRRHRRREEGRRRRPARRHAHLHLGGSGARRPRPGRRQLGDVDVPLAHRRGGDTYAGLMGPMVITRAGHGPPGRQPEGCRPRVLRAVLGDEREPEPVPRRKHQAVRRAPGPGSRRRGLPGVEPDALDQRLRVREPAD